MKLTVPRLLLGAIAINLLLSISASPFYVGAKAPALHVGSTKKPKPDMFFHPQLSDEMQRNKPLTLDPPPDQPGDFPCTIVQICICPLVVCELYQICWEVAENCGGTQ